jgi:ribonuclease Z
VVVTGDTGRCEEVDRQAAGADLLIHDALNRDMILNAARMLDGLGQARRAKMARDIVTYHATPVDAAQAAAAAQAHMLLLTHIVPPLRSEAQEKQFLAGTAEVYSGPIAIARDGQRFSFPPRPREARWRPTP